MKYCIDYKIKYNLNEIEEFYIDVVKESKKIFNFIERHQDKKIVIKMNADLFSENYDVRDFERYDNIVFCFKIRSDIEALYISKIMKGKKVPFFYDSIEMKWNDLIFHIKECGVNEVYIGGRLGFSLADAARFAHNNNVKVRVIPNILQYEGRCQTQKSFYINPYDISVYKKYIDTLEIHPIRDFDNTTVIAKAYKEEKWYGKLKEIIEYYDLDTNAYETLPIAGRVRLTCGKRCENPFNTCTLCDRIVVKTLKGQN